MTNKKTRKKTSRKTAKKTRTKRKKSKKSSANSRRLVLYSGGSEPGNDRLHVALSLLGGKTAKSLTYIPSIHDHVERDFYYQKIKRRYKKFGINKFVYFAVDSKFTQEQMRKALKSDVVYLAGGNTFYFLKHLRRAKMLEPLKRFVKRGGILAGLSAGAIIMTPHISMAGYPPHDCDENDVKLKNWKSLELVDFEFMPHYTGDRLSQEAMAIYSLQNDHRPIFACPDGAGLVVDGEEMRIFGPVYLYHGGRRLKIA